MCISNDKLTIAETYKILCKGDLDELFKLSDRIIVLYEGKVVKEVGIDSATIETIGYAMAGINE